MIKYIRRRIARKELIKLRDELTFYEPLYPLIGPFHLWFTEKWNYIWSKQTNRYEIEPEFFAEIYSVIPGQLTVFKQAIADYGQKVDTSYIKDKIVIMEKMLADGDSERILTLMFLYLQIFERAERYLHLKKREAELNEYIR
ncbi:hypothetical protein [Paenibacillus tianjinensis]|uniref:Uncharacterized protein n=1 Tax=Paenibacillus tianjinensis TaxID=2810347 RepID=A0ABX7LAA2_9BACL|nr:hypothetical protein [Paenibacillus tianjinensis]QSF44298.1 hypothetical protein JRJ22_24275 [Paenibacillus tianjinensis]